MDYKTIIAFFEALEIEDEEDAETDETDQILSNPTCAKQLDKSINDLKEGKGVAVSLDDIWKGFFSPKFLKIKY